MRTALLWVVRPVLALLAYVAGIVIRRPMSGRWLAHYLLGSGKPMRLPHRAEQELAWCYAHSNCRNPLVPRNIEERDMWDEPAEAELIPPCHYADAEELSTCGPFYNEAVGCVDGDSAGMCNTDLYTTVGAVAVWGEDDGSLHYLDVYNWQGDITWTFSCRLAWLPFSVVVKGIDRQWEGLGKPFVTEGRLGPGDAALAPKNTLGNATPASTLLKRVQEWLYDLRKGKIDTTDLPF